MLNPRNERQLLLLLLLLLYFRGSLSVCFTYSRAAKQARLNATGRQAQDELGPLGVRP